jgi:hypothetical protein
MEKNINWLNMQQIRKARLKKMLRSLKKMDQRRGRKYNLQEQNNSILEV